MFCKILKIFMLNEIDCYNVAVLSITPLLGLYGILTTKLHMYTIIFSLIYYLFSMIGITAGYHRLWSHKAYKASFILKLFLVLAGTSAAQGSILWWCKQHRIHHRFTDTEKDPYNSQKGLLWAHIGWLIIINQKDIVIDIEDLNEEPLIRVQDEYYTLFTLIMSLVVPFLIPTLLWGDYRGAFFYSAIVRLVLAHHATFCVNSLAHYLGSSTYDDRLTPKDHLLTAIVTLGEGYHNFHHEFPQDYRNAIKYYQYDPTKWFIYSMYLLGLAYNLKTFPKNQIDMALYHMKKKELDKFNNGINWGKDPSLLPKMSFNEYQTLVKENDLCWIVIGQYVIDVFDFINHHPGGPKYLKMYFGKNATKSFNGGVYAHSNAAKNLLRHMRVAIIC